jgi:hypothetical protein
MSGYTVDERAWYYATSSRATFGFETAEGRVVAVAPYGRRWLIGRTIDEAIELLSRRGFQVIRGDR